MDLATATHEAFTDALNEVFALSAHESSPAPDVAASLVLTSVESQPEQRPGLRQPFVLTFKGAGDAALPQSIYRLEHAGLGICDVFLVPVDSGDGYVLYEAVFN